MSDVSIHFDQDGQLETYLKDHPTGVLLVRFGADWCTYCRMADPVLEELGRTYHDKIKVIKVDIEGAEGDGEAYGVTGIPDVRIFKDGKFIGESLTGFPGREAYDKVIKEAIGE
ncbi:MAG: thioredoxin family protein [Pseudomonadales bacterium]|jgi:thiol-disulfide isomerase/thioredoxin|nr:thioredoxin family protein [Pseudomonadales bacterium]